MIGMEREPRSLSPLSPPLWCVECRSLGIPLVGDNRNWGGVAALPMSNCQGGGFT